MIKKVITFILNFLLIILGISTFIIIIISKTVLNEEYLKSVLVTNNFYQRAYDDIKDDFENYTMQSGLELDILDSLVSKEKVTNDINKRLDSIFNLENFEVDTNSIKEELNSRINNILVENNRVLEESEKTSIEKYENAIVDSYKSGILYGKQLHIPSDLVSKYLKYTVISMIVLILLIIIINRKIKTILNSCGVILLPIGIIISLVKPLVLHRVQNILMLDQKFSNCLVFVLNDIVEKCFKYGIVIAIVGMLFIIISSINFFQKSIEHKFN
ncbi:MAG: hypothetical protein HFJ45_06790 [Clostridia bacterium]|nr:hypothetical protein [Clostridia bacterium]